MARKRRSRTSWGALRALGDHGRGRGVLSRRLAEPLLQPLGQLKQAGGQANPLILLHRVGKLAQ